MNLFKETLAKLKALPGVRSVSLSRGGLATGNIGAAPTAFSVDGYTPSPGEEMNADATITGPDFFTTLRIPLVAGRVLGIKDTLKVAHLGLNAMKGERRHAGFPEAGYVKYAEQLVKLGFKVGIVEQTETPAGDEGKRADVAQRNNRPLLCWLGLIAGAS